MREFSAEEPWEQLEKFFNEHEVPTGSGLADTEGFRFSIGQKTTHFKYMLERIEYVRCQTDTSKACKLLKAFRVMTAGIDEYTFLTGKWKQAIGALEP